MVLDHQEARGWADNHDVFVGWTARLARDIRNAFGALHRAQYDRPWRGARDC